MKLSETVEMMNSDAYTERFCAEYMQLVVRMEGLRNMLQGYKMGLLPFQPKCSYELLYSQLEAMQAYAAVLEQRAEIEDIYLEV